MTNITSITVAFGNGVKREDFGPLKKAEVTITAAVSEDEDGAAALDQISTMAIAKVAAMLDAPKPIVASAPAAEPQQETATVGEAPARRIRGPNRPKPNEPQPDEQKSEEQNSSEPQPSEQQSSSDEQKPEASPSAEAQPTEDEWAASADDIVVTDAELLSATSKRAGDLGAREPIVKLIASFATRTEGAPFKVQEIPANQRKDYLNKLAALTA